MSSTTMNFNPLRSPSAAPRSIWRMTWRQFRRNAMSLTGLVLLVILLLGAILAPYITTRDPGRVNFDQSTRLTPPSATHWFGTDHHGRDIFSRIIHGMSLTLYVGFASVILGATVGVVLGIISGYYGGRIDTIIMRTMDVLLAFPGILLALAIVSVLGGSLQNVIIAVAISSVPVFAFK